NPIGPLCQNSTPPTLPATSLNGINGTWSPTTINTAVAGSSTYTFTPTGSTCAVPVSIDITITAQVTPTFNAIGPLCQNSTPPTLPATSLNGINGTWSPTTINTAVAGSSTYTFTPTGSTCAVPVSIDITITAQVTPTFNAIGPLCQNSSAPPLPGTSLNGINGTWSPATINTAVAGSSTYTFTPTGSTCAVPVSINITITAQVTPTFNAIGPLCQNSSAPPLPGTSLNGINGTWSPTTINTAVAGSSTYTFTPTGSTCAVPVSINITITAQVTPTFNAIGPLCQNSSAPPLPGTSLNGINGTWSPATINTAVAGSSTYTFTPTGSTCAVPVSINITIPAQVTPTFNAIGPLCQNSSAPPLPGTSLNGINGTWSPTTISTAVAGSSTYTFTPTGSTCAVPVSIDITITAQVTP